MMLSLYAGVLKQMQIILYDHFVIKESILFFMYVLVISGGGTVCVAVSLQFIYQTITNQVGVELYLWYVEI
jgi:hypothetical protein